MSWRRALIAAVLVCGVCVFGFAHAGNESDAHEADAQAADDGHDEAAARYRSNQCRHWRQLATGATASAH